MDYFYGFLIALVITVVGMPPFIKLIQHKKLGQTTREEGPLWHEVKGGTPTMGGTVFLIAIVITLFIMNLLTAWNSVPLLLIGLAFLLFGGIGFVDDFIAVFKKQNEGLSSRQKFLAQLAFSFILVLLANIMGQRIEIQLFSWTIRNLFLTSIFAFFWITGFSNAVNLTDGLDGLATGLSIVSYLTYAIVADYQGKQQLALACLIIVGALIGFLIFNVKPAKIFMGDVGSLALGAGLALVSLLLGHPFGLLLVGSVFVIETASVILQVASFKLRGKRIFKMSPIHHHFEMLGWSEKKVVYTFWLAGLLSAFLYFLLLN